MASEKLPPVSWKHWQIFSFKTISSTNEEARNYPAWSAIVADTQTAGRGRHRRHWTSDHGGLWLSAVLPTPGSSDHWKPLPLVIGLTVIRTLQKLHVSARMRWPNDIMVGDQKLAGLLLERYSDDQVVAGIGINLTNTPAEQTPELAGTVTRLADLSPSMPNRDEFLISLLNHLHEIHQQMCADGIEPLVPELNRMWGDLPRPVELDIQGEIIPGHFMGITDNGDLILTDATGSESIHNAAYVTMLRETDPTSTNLNHKKES